MSRYSTSLYNKVYFPSEGYKSLSMPVVSSSGSVKKDISMQEGEKKKTSLWNARTIVAGAVGAMIVVGLYFWLRNQSSNNDCVPQNNPRQEAPSNEAKFRNEQFREVVEKQETSQQKDTLDSVDSIAKNVFESRSKTDNEFYSLLYPVSSADPVCLATDLPNNSLSVQEKNIKTESFSNKKQTSASRNTLTVVSLLARVRAGREEAENSLSRSAAVISS